MDAWRQHLGQGQAWGAQPRPWKAFLPNSQRAQHPGKTSLGRRVAAGASPTRLAPQGGAIAACTPTPQPTLDAVSSASFFKRRHYSPLKETGSLGRAFMSPQRHQ